MDPVSNPVTSDFDTDSPVIRSAAAGFDFVPITQQDSAERIESRLNAADELLSRIDQDSSGRAGLKTLIIQIPCYNEAGTLAITLDALPKSIVGFDAVQTLIIDDGSTDETIDVAKRRGVDHIVRLPHNQGLAKAFMAGIEECLRLGADVIVNTDADNQYCADDIEKLVEPIVSGTAEIAVGARPIATTPHFSTAKKILQKLGSWVVRKASSANVADAPSGFRAFHRDAAMQLNVFSNYTYTLETLIQAGQKNMAIASVPIRTNQDLRPSRLLKSIPSYVHRSATTIVRIFMTYRPLYFFGVPGGLLCAASAMLCLRYLLLFFAGSGGGHVQSLILASIFMGAGLLAIVAGLVGDLISVNRKLLEKMDLRIQRMDEKIQRLAINSLSRDRENAK